VNICYIEIYDTVKKMGDYSMFLEKYRIRWDQIAEDLEQLLSNFDHKGCLEIKLVNKPYLTFFT